jgi:hypothetical protein
LGFREQGESVVMPDRNNRYVKQDLQEALNPAELRIVQFQPPAAALNQGNSSNPNFRVNVPEVQRQVADKAALERTNALFDFLSHFIPQFVNDEIGRQQIVQRISNLEARLASMETGLARTGSI